MNLKRSLVGLACVVSSAISLHAALIPANRLVDWTPGVSVGVPGGIPTNRTRLIDVTQSPYNADKTGSTNASSAIQAAITAATAGDIVYLPAGRYRVDGTISIGPTKKNITIRGAGMNSTIIDARVTNSVFNIGSGSDYRWNYPSSGTTITAGLTKGSTTISIASTTAFSAGQIVQIAFENQNNDAAIAAGATPVFHVAGYEKSRRQLSRVVSKTASSLTISPALYFTPDAGLSAEVHVAQLQSEGVGIEDLAIDGTNGSMIFPIYFEQCYGCWVKGVKVTKTSNYGMYFTNSLNCEVRQCYVADRKTGGSNGAGVLCGGVGACLFEDNIILQLFPAFEINFSSMGNVVGYNLMENSTGGTLNTNHGPHNSFNLYEGNVTPNVQADGYFGSASDDTFFRNWIHGTNSARTLRTFRVSLNRFTRNYSLVGNILGETGMASSTVAYSFGNPNLGNSSYSGTAKPSAGRFWSDWKATAGLTVRTSDTAGTILMASGSFFQGQLGYLTWGSGKRAQFTVSSVAGNLVSFTGATGDPLPALSTVQVYTGPAGYQTLDQDVEATTVLKGNYSYTSRSIASTESLGGDTLPNSLYRGSKPGFFGNLGWPAFNPLNPSPDFTSIPAGYRYINGSDVPGVVPDVQVSPPNAPSNLRVTK